MYFFPIPYLCQIGTWPSQKAPLPHLFLRISQSNAFLVLINCSVTCSHYLAFELLLQNPLSTSAILMGDHQKHAGVHAERMSGTTCSFRRHWGAELDSSWTSHPFPICLSSRVNGVQIWICFYLQSHKVANELFHQPLSLNAHTVA